MQTTRLTHWLTCFDNLDFIKRKWRLLCKVVKAKPIAWLCVRLQRFELHCTAIFAECYYLMTLSLGPVCLTLFTDLLLSSLQTHSFIARNIEFNPKLAAIKTALFTGPLFPENWTALTLQNVYKIWKSLLNKHLQISQFEIKITKYFWFVSSNVHSGLSFFDLVTVSLHMYETAFTARTEFFERVVIGTLLAFHKLSNGGGC